MFRHGVHNVYINSICCKHSSAYRQYFGCSNCCEDPQLADQHKLLHREHGCLRPSRTVVLLAALRQRRNVDANCLYKWHSGFNCLQTRNVPQSGVTDGLYSKPCVYRLRQICSHCFSLKSYDDNECKNTGDFSATILVDTFLFCFALRSFCKNYQRRWPNILQIYDERRGFDNF